VVAEIEKCVQDNGEKTLKNGLNIARDIMQDDKLASFTDGVSQNNSQAMNLLPERLLLYLLQNINGYLESGLPAKSISPNRKLKTLTPAEIRSIAAICKNFVVNIDGSLPLDKAFVTCGGVSLKEINPKTMESKLVRGLYFCGEVVDINGYTGGFNLTAAFTTGHLAGTSAKAGD
jgi:predicted flavoprotein YhiN